ncbi:MAG TPA: calcium/sodium antiporter [Actinobacteria bacterium]|nr:calcium/sodium antiporter [Actinomycetota bacterium]
MPLIIWVAIFIVSLSTLIKAAGYFTDAAEKIGLALGIPPFIVGVTIVAAGTSLPELAAAIFAMTSGSSDIVIGAVVGSNITNIFLVLGVSVIIAKKIRIIHELIRVDLPMLAASAFFVAVISYDGTITRPEAFLALLGIFFYLSYTVAVDRQVDSEIEKEIEKELETKKASNKDLAILVISGIFITIGAKYTIDSVVRIAEMINIGTEVIALSAVALGTSLPELAVSITAARKGLGEIAVGNVLGSNIFNSFAVLGVAGMIGPVTVPGNIISFALPLMIIATLLFFFITQDKEVTKWEGWMLVLFYVFFIGKLFAVL